MERVVQRKKRYIVLLPLIVKNQHFCERDVFYSFKHDIISLFTFEMTILVSIWVESTIRKWN